MESDTIFDRYGEISVENTTKTAKAQQWALNKYVKEKYDRINIPFPKGERDKVCHEEVSE